MRAGDKHVPPPNKARDKISSGPHVDRFDFRPPYRLGGSPRFKAGENISSGPHVGRWASSPLPSGVCPTLHSGGGGESVVAYMWADSLHHHCRLPYGGFRTNQSGGQNQQWPTCMQIGYITRGIWVVPNASKRGTKSAMAHMRADWLPHPLPSRGSPTPHRTGGGGGSTVTHAGRWLHHPCSTGGLQGLRAGDKINCVPPPYKARDKISSGPHVGRFNFHHPYRLGGSQRFKAGDKISSGPHVGRWASSPLPSVVCPMLYSGGGGGGNQ